MTSTAPTSTDPSRGSGTRRSSGEVRALLVEAARELFTEQGYRATTRDIATRAGVAESLIFTRFGSKAELFQVTVVSAFTDFIDDFVTSWEANPVDSDIEEIWKLVRRLNQYVEERKPWELSKDEGSAGALESVLYGLAEGLRVTTLLLHAYMPETTGRLLDALDEPNRELPDFGSRGGGQSLGQLAPLFPKLAPA